MRQISRLVTLIILLLTVAVSPARAEKNVLFIFDASGSMKKTINGKTRINIARNSFVETVLSMPQDIRLGLLMFGAQRRKDCTDIQMISPVEANDRDTLVLSMAGLEAKGETPIADAIVRGARSFSKLQGQENSIVVLTDGIEECHGDPCAVAAAISGQRINLKISIVGFSLKPEERKAIECVSRLTGGQFYDASDADSLVAALSKVKRDIIQTARPPPAAAPQPPVAQPVTIEKTPDRHRFTAVAMLAPGKPYGSVQAVNWSIARLTGGKPESAPVVSTSTLSNNVNSELPNGKYVIAAKVGLASGETSADVMADKDMSVDVVLNAGVVEIQAFAASGVAVPTDASSRVRLDVEGPGGANAGTYSSVYTVAVPAGHWTVKAQLGNANISAAVDVEAGAAVKVPVVLDAGRLVLRGRSARQADPLQGVRWRVVSVKDGADVYGETYFTESAFNLAAGDYKVTATLGQATTTDTVTVHAGEVVDKSFVFPDKQ